MNILFISCLSQSLSTGPAWSVPARIAAQEKIDSVMWINLSDAVNSHWKKVLAYHNISEFKKVSLNSFPAPFNHPDLVIFEGFYGGIKEIRLALQCWRKNIPYIIVPRSSLTYQAMHNKARIKKEIAHFLFYDRFVSRSLAVQYLTKQEYEDSKYRFTGAHLILPNGINIPDKTKSKFSKGAIKGVFIGRIDIYQKGIDLLLDVLRDMKETLLEARFSLVLYGPKLKDYYEVESLIQQYGLCDIVSMGGEILGIEKQKVLLESDIFFLTSRFEGHPMSLLEAMSYGVPSVITTGVNMRTEVEQYNAGWCCDFDKEDLKRCMLKMLQEYVNAPLKGEGARKLSLKYEWDILAQDLHQWIVNNI